MITTEIHEVSKNNTPYEIRLEKTIKINEARGSSNLEIIKKWKAYRDTSCLKGYCSCWMEIQIHEKINMCKRTNNVKQSTTEENPLEMSIHDIGKQNIAD